MEFLKYLWIIFRMSSLKSIPDIFNLDMKNVKIIDSLFFNCSSLITLPEYISKWETKKLKV